MRKFTIWLLILFAFASANAQVVIQQSFSTTTTPSGWSLGSGSITGTQSCLTNSWRKNVYSTFTSGPSLATETQVSSGDDLTIAFDYKIVDWSAATVATDPYDGSITTEISLDNGSTWSVIAGVIDGTNHVSANTCATVNYVVPGASVPSGSQIKVRWNNSWTSGDYYVYLDNISITQPITNPPLCTSVSSPANGATNVTNTSLEWPAATGGPSGYKLTIGTTSGGSDILNNSDLGNVLTSAAFNFQPNTTYYVKVVPYNAIGDAVGCTETSFTTCATTTSFSQNFDALTTPAIPACWFKVSSTGSANTQTTSPSSSPNTLYFWGSSVANISVLRLEPVSNLGAGTHRLSMKMRANFSTGGVVEIGYLTNPVDHTTFVSLGSVIASSTTYSEYFFAPPAGTYSPFLALRHTGVPSNSLLIDDVNWEAIPSCLEPTVPLSSATSSTTATFSWTAPSPSPADGYQYEIRVSGAAGSGTTGLIASGSLVSGVLSTNITGLDPNTNYIAYVRADCGLGNFSSWTPASNFFTGYCSPAPTSVDGQGITNVTYGTINNTTVAEAGNYGDYSSIITDVIIGEVDTLKIQYSTGFTYDTKVWIDFNDDLDFNDPGEEVFSGVSLATNPTVLNAPIFIPVGSPQGQHRMRIGGQDNGPVNPCYTGSWGSFEDYTVNVICPTTIPAPTSPVGDIICANLSTEVSATGINGATLNWFAAATGGTSLGTNDTLTTGVLSTTTSFYLEQSFPGCTGASSRLEVTTIVNAVNLSLTAIDNTCNGYAAGSFALGTVECGTAPFTYSVDGGAFGSIPTNLVAGNYSIVAKDANNNESQPISLTIAQPATVIATPSVTNAIACDGATSELISAVGIAITQTPVVVSFDITAQPVEVNAAPGNVIATATMPTLPAGAVITSATLSVPNITANGFSWQADVRLGLSGALVNTAGAGVGAINGAGTFNYTRTFSPTIGTGNTIEILYWDAFNDVNPGADATFTTGVGAATLSLTYTLPSDVTWWTAATGGTQIGTTASIEAIGTSVMASPAVAGTYTFYAQTETGTCSSITRAPLTLTVTPNPAPAITASNPTLCDGSSILLVSSIENGNVWSSSASATNDTLSVSTAGSFTVTVTDVNGCVGTSAPYVTTITALPVVSAGIDQTVCATSNVTLVGSGAPTLTWNNGVTDNTPFVATATNTYIVTGTDANGCVNVDTVTVTVNALPVPVITGNLVICAGDSTLLVASSETGNVWSTTATTDSIFVSTAGSITVTETDANGCVATSAPVVVVVNALPAVNAGADYAVCQNTTTSLSGSGAVSYVWDNNVSNNIAFLVTETNDYVVTGTDANGCVNSDTITVTANALPAVNGGDNIEQCGDQSITLTATGATAYAWSGGVENGTAFNAPFGTSVYIVTGVDAFGCSNTDAVTVSIYANPTATITPINGVTLQATPAGASYQWINCSDNQPIAGAVTPVFTATENGSYAVIVIGMGGCADTSACFNVTTVGIEKTELDASINLFPNPTTSNVTLAMSSDKAVNVTVFDAQGKVVSIIDNAQNGSIIGLQHVENGVYMVQVSNETGSKVFRVVKQ
jgi:hypothetical protein